MKRANLLISGIGFILVPILLALAVIVGASIIPVGTFNAAARSTDALPIVGQNLSGTIRVNNLG